MPYRIGNGRQIDERDLGYFVNIAVRSASATACHSLTVYLRSKNCPALIRSSTACIAAPNAFSASRCRCSASCSASYSSRASRQAGHSSFGQLGYCRRATRRRHRRTSLHPSRRRNRAKHPIRLGLPLDERANLPLALDCRLDFRRRLARLELGLSEPDAVYADRSFGLHCRLPSLRLSKYNVRATPTEIDVESESYELCLSAKTPRREPFCTRTAEFETKAPARPLRRLVPEERPPLNIPSRRLGFIGRHHPGVEPHEPATIAAPPDSLP